MNSGKAALGLSAYFLVMVLIAGAGLDYAFRNSSTTTELIKAKHQCVTAFHAFKTPFVLVVEDDSVLYKAYVPFEFWNDVDTSKYVFVMQERGLFTNRLYRRSILDLGITYPLFTLEEQPILYPKNQPTGPEKPVGF